MTDPSELVDALVEMLRNVPDLVSEVGARPERIYAYHDQYPKQPSLALAIHQMPVPSIMAAWQGSQPASFAGNEVWRHQITLYLRARETFDGDPPAAYYRLFRLITKGIPNGSGQPVQYATVHPSCYPMDTPSIQRQTDAEGLDYFEMAINFTEIGDD